MRFTQLTTSRACPTLLTALWVLASSPALQGCGGKDPDAGVAQGQGKDKDSATGGSKGKDKGPSDKGSDTANDADDPKGEDNTDAGDESSGKEKPKFDMGAFPDKSEKKEGDDCDCDPDADLIYLWGSSSNKGHLWSFDPSEKPDKAFKDLGNPGCDIPVGQHPFSMGVDRQANAWLTIRSSGTMFKSNTKKPGSCEKTSHTPGNQGFKLFGMAFVEHPNDGRCDQLYLHSFDGKTPSEGSGAGQLGELNPETLEIKTIGPIDFNGGELTGTGDGRLFAFAGKPSRLLEYDAKTAKVIKEVDLGGLDLSSSFAFAFWGGDFYFFTDYLGSIPIQSKVTKLDYTGDGSVSTFIEKAPLRVAGAGVSVCAPLDEPPPK